jgi:hypothetical protein
MPGKPLIGNLADVYTVQAEEVESGSGPWNRLIVSVLKNGEKIGEYERNYRTLFQTFFPFERNGRHLALVSPDYTATSVMALDEPGCPVIGGEDPSPNGFCPVEFYVPRFQKRRYTDRHGPVTESVDYERLDAAGSHEVIADGYMSIGFVSGCIWADDSSWKLECLDLSEADKGIIKRDNRFGYLELPDSMRLPQAVQVEEDDRIRITSTRSFKPKGEEHRLNDE